MKVQRSAGDSVDGLLALETVRIYFYALKDPITEKIRYIGQTVNPGNRLRNHIYEAKKNNKNHKERWIIQLLRKNEKPIMEILWEEVMTAAEANSFETDLIQFYKDEGCDLTNSDDNFPVILTLTENIDGTYSLFVNSQTDNGVFEERYEKDKLSAIVNKMYCFLNND